MFFWEVPFLWQCKYYCSVIIVSLHNISFTWKTTVVVVELWPDESRARNDKYSKKILKTAAKVFLHPSTGQKRWEATVKSEVMMSLQSRSFTSQHIVRAWWHAWGAHLNFPQRAPMWTAATWKTRWTEEGGLGNQDVFTLLCGFTSTSTLPVQKHAASWSVLRSIKHPELGDLLTYFHSLILHFAFILANFCSFFQAVLTKASIAPQSLLAMAL